VVGFIPVVGQLAVFAIYTYYSALMFIDYPTSRRHWGLGRKLSWLRNYSAPAFRLGILPAAVSLVPLLNIFMIALLFPLLTIHATLNFVVIEGSGPLPPAPKPAR
jgi:CysZ protein